MTLWSRYPDLRHLAFLPRIPSIESTVISHFAPDCGLRGTWKPFSVLPETQILKTQLPRVPLAPLHTSSSLHFPPRASGSTSSLCSNNLPNLISNQRSRRPLTTLHISASPNAPSRTPQFHIQSPSPARPRPHALPSTLRYRARRPPRLVQRVLPLRPRRRPPPSLARSPPTAATALTMKSRRTPESTNPD